MDYKSAMEYISSNNKFGKKEDLFRMQKLMELLENPQDELKYIHVAGTNGKGSIVTFISNILKETNLKVGIFTSPYIHKFTDRIKVNNEEIKEEEIIHYIKVIKSKIDIMIEQNIEKPTEFEIITAMAFLHYKKLNCDIVVLEVGIGGIIDSTNIIKDSEISIIATIGYDHINLLGKTLEEIAEKKAGIIKKNGNLILYYQENKNVYNVIKKICEQKNVKLIYINLDNLSIKDSNLEYQKFNYKNYKDLKINIIGKYQIYNALVAIEVIDFLILKGYNILKEDIRKGILKTNVPGRFEILYKNPMFILDGAHNIQGAKILLENLEKFFKNKKINFIVGFTQNKDYYDILKTVFPIAKKFLTITADEKRGVKAEEIELYIKKYNIEVFSFLDVNKAIDLILKESTKDDIICAFGSLYYIGKVRKYFKLIK